METILSFIKRETVFLISASAAVITMLFVHPSAEYLEYIDFPVLIILFCLMAVVEGLKKNGAFDILSEKLLSGRLGQKSKYSVLVLLCFFTSMLITNDVALIAFVPFTIYLAEDKHSVYLIYIIVLETVAANLGSMVTPIGNPQNLYLYHYYNLSIEDFLKITVPAGMISIFLIFAASVLLIGSSNGKARLESVGHILKVNSKRNIIFFSVLFIICVMTVLKMIEYKVCLMAVIVSLVFIDKSIFKYIDYWLLFTFVNFFVVVGNLTNISAVDSLISDFVSGNEFYAGILVSQIISNVPASILLASFTDNFKGLILGVNIGGLGTLIASLASLISFKYYSLIDGAKRLKYFFVFTAVNTAFVVLLTVIFRRT